jgi:hypothetical protein
MYCAKGMAALKDNLESVCTETIQACILVGNNCFGDGDADAESLYFGKSSSLSHDIFKRGTAC